MHIARPKGTNDFLPADTAQWVYIEKMLRETCVRFGYKEIRTPVFEDTGLFMRGVGGTTDIVQKEMYTFCMKDEHSFTLRPENTASVVRAYLENKLYGVPAPVKLYYIGPMFRYENPQAGRFRQFHQFGIELFGSADAAADAEIIGLAWDFYSSLGISGLSLNINSVGCGVCRPDHKEAIMDFLRPVLGDLCEICQGRFERNPLRILDCKNERCRELIMDAPAPLDCLCGECREHFEELKGHLESMGISFAINRQLVRGLDYYTKTAFEILAEGIGAQNAVAGGGRYDDLVQSIGGEPTPAVGFALGMERVFAVLDEQNIKLPNIAPPDVFFIGLPHEDQNISRCVSRFSMELRRNGMSIERNLLQRGLKAQLKAADRSGALYAVILGLDEFNRGEVTVRKMSDGEQEKISLNTLVDYFLQTGIMEEKRK